MFVKGRNFTFITERPGIVAGRFADGMEQVVNQPKDPCRQVTS